jgi:hypothetical protein
VHLHTIYVAAKTRATRRISGGASAGFRAHLDDGPTRHYLGSIALPTSEIALRRFRQRCNSIIEAVAHPDETYELVRALEARLEAASARYARELVAWIAVENDRRRAAGLPELQARTYRGDAEADDE